MKLQLLGKMLTFVITPIVIGLAILGFLASNLSSSSLSDMADRQLSELATKQASEINNIISNLNDIGRSQTSLSNARKLVTIAANLGEFRESSKEYVDTQ